MTLRIKNQEFIHLGRGLSLISTAEFSLTLSSARLDKGAWKNMVHKRSE